MGNSTLYQSSGRLDSELFWSRYLRLNDVMWTFPFWLSFFKGILWFTVWNVKIFNFVIKTHILPCGIHLLRRNHLILKSLWRSLKEWFCFFKRIDFSSYLSSWRNQLKFLRWWRKGRLEGLWNWGWTFLCFSSIEGR